MLVEDLSDSQESRYVQGVYHIYLPKGVPASIPELLDSLRDSQFALVNVIEYYIPRGAYQKGNNS